MITSTTLPRIAAAGAAATGLAATAQAQFTGMFATTPPEPNTYYMSSQQTRLFGQWTFNNTASTPSSFTHYVYNTETTLALSAYNNGISGSGLSYFDFTLTPIATEGTIAFDYSYPKFGAADAYSAYTTDGSTWIPFNAASGSSFSVPVSLGDIFGFRVGDNYLAEFTSTNLVISNISFTAVPEPGNFGLVAGVASLGYVGLVATRRRRERAALAA